MNKEQLAEAYLNLIHQLLTCPNGEEQATLHANSHLVDEAFVEVMKWAAAKMAEEGESNAEWLQSFAEQLAEMMEEWEQLNDEFLELYNASKYDEAIPIAEQAAKLALQLWGEAHANVATALNNLAVLYDSQGKYSEAKPLFQQAIEIDKIALPDNHPSLGIYLNNLALLYYSQGQYSEAEPLYQQAIEILKIALPNNHPYLASSLRNLANLYRSQEQYSEAESLYQQAIEIDKIALPDNHPDLVADLKNLGGLYYYQGRYSEAEPLYQQAIEIDKIALPANHPDLATDLNYLALLYYSQGKYSEAETLFQQAIEIHKIALPENHPDLAADLNNLGALYEFQGRYSEAKLLYQQVIEIDKIALPENHRERATHLNNLAGLYYSQGRYEAAEPLYQQTIEIDKIALPENHRERATHLNNLAVLYDSQGKYEAAEPLYQQAIEIAKIAFPTNHRESANYLNNLAGLLAKTDRPKEAFKLMLKASKIQDKTIQIIFASSSESDRLAHIQEKVRPNLEKFLSLVYQYLPHSQAAKQAALNLVLKRKALTATALAAQNQAVFSGRYPQLQEIFSRWRQKCDQLLGFTYQVPPPEKQEAHKQQLAQLQKECNELERQLAREVPEIAMQQQMGNRRAVASELPEGAKLLEFVRFRVFNFQNDSWQKARYLAFVLAQGKPSEVETIDLGEAENIDRLISVYRESVMELPEASVEVPAESGRSPQPSLERGAMSDFIETSQPALEIDESPQPPLVRGAKIVRGAEMLRGAEMGATLNMWDDEPDSTEKPAKHYVYDSQPGKQLREAVFDKLRDKLAGCSHLVIAADGHLNLVPFQILPEDDETKLEDRYNISYVSVGRELLRRRIKTNGTPNEPLIIADPNFDYSENDASIAQPESNMAVSGMNISQMFGTLASVKFERVKATGDFAKTIAQQLGVEPFLQNEATGDHLLKCQSPKLLIIATHGYYSQRENQYGRLLKELWKYPLEKEAEILAKNYGFLDEEFLEYIEWLRNLEDYDNEIREWLGAIYSLVKQQINSTSAKPPVNNIEFETFKPNRHQAKVENPMMRSAVAFTGANTWFSGGKLPDNFPTMVFAQDIAGVDLWETDLTILIACQSGLGDVQTGEGVFGLRRAFAVAGSKTLIMSLWSVPTLATMLLMEQFLDYLKAGIGRAEALKEAQKYIINVTVGELQKSQLGRDILAELNLGNNLEIESKPLAHPYFWGAWICQGEVDNFQM